MKRHEVTADQWEAIQPIFPGGRRKRVDRLHAKNGLEYQSAPKTVQPTASKRDQNRPARRPGKHGDYAAAMPPLTGRPAQTGRTEPKPLQAGPKKRILALSTPHRVAGSDSLNHSWPGSLPSEEPGCSVGAR
jgi:hypothetical protein